MQIELLNVSECNSIGMFGGRRSNVLQNTFTSVGPIVELGLYELVYDGRGPEHSVFEWESLVLSGEYEQGEAFLRIGELLTECIQVPERGYFEGLTRTTKANRRSRKVFHRHDRPTPDMIEALASSPAACILDRHV
jgi:hypothetical protein